MDIRRFAAASAALLLAMMSVTGCGNKSASSTSEEAEGVLIPSVDANVEAASDGPKLYFNDVTAAPGEIAEVSLCVKDAAQKWAMCGIHVTFSEELECQMEDVEKRAVKYTKGDASEDSMGPVCMLWRDGLPDELVNQHLGCLFFTEVFKSDDGGDGEIAKFYLKVPDNAVSGTEYSVGIYYDPEMDIFIDKAGNAAMQKYVFENWKGGKITVK